MDVKTALKEQYHAGLANLAECVEKCPLELWRSYHADRYVWRIVFHTAYYTNLYMAQTEAEHVQWPGNRYLRYEDDTADGYTQDELMEFIAFVDGRVDQAVDDLDLSSQETGFDWYRNMTKLSHQLMNIRHIQGHVGQLSELIMSLDPAEEIGWVAKGTSYKDRDD